eukprot:TRINITY_DN2660_c0_g1_i1.p1 TRINITY_DN2660_c0_g1~~TRINITY_DN2660_c0_g1_i1.p1  ORF type:complete len:55 (-),score=11.03 TRINITY_DN2660_c0_g1_i1:5-169(-)
MSILPPVKDLSVPSRVQTQYLPLRRAATRLAKANSSFIQSALLRSDLRVPCTLR